MMDRFGVERVFGMHNMPGLPVGRFAIRPGPLMASADVFDIRIEGLGGHAARPNDCIDPAIVVSQIVQSFQSIVSRNADPIESLVISVTQIHMGDAYNVIAQTARMCGTVRTLKPELRDLAEERMAAVCRHIGPVNGAKVEIDYERGYPVTENHPEETAFAVGVAREIVGEDNVDDNAPPLMGGEDFSYMLNARPGAFMFVGQGDTAGLHHPEYDFNDDIIPIGCSYWVKLVETALPAAG